MAFSLAFRALMLALALVGWMAAPALAAPQQISSDPEAGAELETAPSRVTVTFSEPLQAGSNLEVHDECGQAVAHGDATIGGPVRNELSIAVHSKPRGTYTVDYVATGVTGSTTDSFTFTVTSGESCDGGDGGGHDDGHGDGKGDGNGNGNGHGDGHGDGGGDDGGHGGRMDHGDAGGHDDGAGHSGGSHPRGDHKDMGHMNGKHKKDGKHDKHKRHEPRKPSGADQDGIGPQAIGNSLPTDIPTGTTVLVSLGLAVLLGAVGGWVLRVSTPS